MLKRIISTLAALAYAVPALAIDLQSTTAPGRVVPSLTNGEIAINRADRTLFFKNVDGTIGIGALLNATAAGRQAVEQGQADALTVGGATLPSVLAGKAPLASPALTGTPTAPTAAAGTNTTQLATTAFVSVLGATKANVAGQTFTGAISAPSGSITTGALDFGSRTAQLINLYGTAFAIGIQDNTLYTRTSDEFAVHAGGAHSPTQGAPGTGGTNLMRLSPSLFTYKGQTVYHAGNFNPATKANLNTANTFTARQVDEYADPARLIKNTSGSTGAFIGDTFNVTQIGRYNPLATAANGIAANTFKSVLGIGDDGKVGSLTNNFGGPLYRNILDDGTGKSQFSGATLWIGPNAASTGPVYYSGANAGGQPAGPDNFNISGPSWSAKYYGGPDFGNTNSVAVQRGIRCTTVADWRQYEACDNVDFYSRTGYLAPWSANTAYAVGDTRYNGDFVYSVVTAGTSAASGGPTGTSGTNIADGTVRWKYEGTKFSDAKVGWSLGAVAYSGSGDVWGMNPNLVLGQGFKAKAYAMEIDLGNNSGFDSYVGSPVPGPEGIWLGGAYQNTSIGGMTVGGFPKNANGTPGTKPMFVFAYWCKDAYAAGQSCYEDWSNSYAGFHTPSFAQKQYDVWAQSTSEVAIYANGASRTAGVLAENTGPVGIQVRGAQTFAAFADTSNAPRSISIQGTHDRGIDLSGTFNQFQISGTGWNVDPTGKLTMTGNTVTVSSLKANSVISNSSSPYAFWRANGGTANQRTFAWAPAGTNLYLQVYNDADAFVSNVIGFDASTGNVAVTNRLTASSYSVGTSAGVTCNAAPTANFRTINGIVTAC